MFYINCGDNFSEKKISLILTEIINGVRIIKDLWIITGVVEAV